MTDAICLTEPHRTGMTQLPACVFMTVALTLTSPWFVNSARADDPPTPSPEPAQPHTDQPPAAVEPETADLPRAVEDDTDGLVSLLGDLRGAVRAFPESVQDRSISPTRSIASATWIRPSKKPEPPWRLIVMLPIHIFSWAACTWRSRSGSMRSSS